MKQFKQLFSRKRFLITSALLIVIVASISPLNSCMQMRTSNKGTAKRFQEAGVKHQILTFSPTAYNFETRTIKTSLQKNTTAIVFIHGAPGSSNAFYDYLADSTLLSKATLYSVDRVGYGYSDFGNSLTSIEEQSKIICEIIDSLVSEDSVIVVGHSFGGPIAAYVSTLNKRVSHLVMLAPANDPANEKIFWFSYFGKWKSTKWLLPKTLQVAGHEKFSHAEELEKIKPIWIIIDVPTLHFHGKEDAIVPFVNLEYTKNLIPKSHFSEIIFEKENHFIPWTQKEKIIEELVRIIN